MMIRRMIQCPFCYERISESVDECQSHCEENHRDKIDRVLAKDFTLADYWNEEVVFFTLKKILLGSKEEPGKVEDLVSKFLPQGSENRKRLLKLRLQVCLWPCTHEGDDNDPDNLDDCCDARRRFGEFMNVMCDAYGDDDDDGDGSE
jgi:hypothetical protein